MWEEIEPGVYGFFLDKPVEVFYVDEAKQRIKELDNMILAKQKEFVAVDDGMKEDVKEAVINKNNEIQAEIDVMIAEKEGLEARLKEIGA